MTSVKLCHSRCLTKLSALSNTTRRSVALSCVTSRGHILPARRSKVLAPTSDNPRRHYASSNQNESFVYKSPLKDINIPENPFLPHYIFEKWNTFGNNVALIDSMTDQRITYNELHRDIVRIGSALVKQGVAKGDVMTIFLPNCLEFVSIYLAAAAIGMTVSAVNPVYNSDELQHAISLSDTNILIVCKETADVTRTTLTKTHVEKVICIDGSAGFQPLSNLQDDDGKSFPDNIDYNSKDDVIALPYSSGTTGFPKGVMLTSFSLVANLEQMLTQDLLAYTADDVFVCSLPLFHGFGLIIIMMAASRVGSTMIVSRKFDPVEYLKTVERYKATFLHTVPPMMVLFAKHPLMDKCDFSSVRKILCAAAPVSPSVMDEARNRMISKAVFTQGYGLTEASPALSLSPVFKTRPETVGVVIHNTQMKVRDVSSDKLLGPNEEGELCFKGPQVMKGYLKNQEATDKTIVDGWLHTGDIGKIDDEGFITITDRLKELIKYKGYQVAPAELEALLLTHPSVADCAVIGKPDDVAGELPRAYVTLKAGHTATGEDIENFVKRAAAPFKQLRGGVEFIPEIPKSASGKILRRVLKDELRTESS